MSTAEQYAGREREQEFVKQKDRLLWSYCIRRFKARWAGVSPTRAIPQGVVHEAARGWWFPKLWVSEFSDEHGERKRRAAGD